MKEDKIMDDMHRRLLKQYHTLCGMMGMSPDDKVALISGYGVTSSRDLSQHQLVDLCGWLSDQLAKRGGYKTMDKLRKQLIGVIGVWLELQGRERQNLPLIKAIACRAAGVEHFNRIPRHRLQSLYGAFSTYNKDLKSVGDMRKVVQEIGQECEALPFDLSKIITQ